MKHLLALCLLFFFATPVPVALAASDDAQPHLTVIINQVRGSSCCDAGSDRVFRSQAELLQRHALQGNFALRYDAVQDGAFRAVVKEHPELELGGLLEIIPQLAADAGVPYAGTPESWHEAQHVFLIGYPQEQRKKLIDTYMTAFHQQFGRYPAFTNAWLIDAWSLQYLREKYGVVAHELTREQFGTDSYTLYGGPPHTPYWPSAQWPLIPDPQMRGRLPLILRQTIDDPVWSYGDQSNSFTSQPNDYMIRRVDSKYFQHLFTQAHRQPGELFTFALLGLENSMPEAVQQEYARQMAVVAEWQRGDQQRNQVLSVSAAVALIQQNSQAFSVYAGQDQQSLEERAYWVTTPAYRARVRFSGGEVFISDLRIYDPAMSDPYAATTARSYGWWIVPFILDGSRFWRDSARTMTLATASDSLTDRGPKVSPPTRIILSKEAKSVEVERVADQLTLTQDGRVLATFTAGYFSLAPGAEMRNASAPIDAVIPAWQWLAENGKGVWGFAAQVEDNLSTRLKPFFTSGALQAERQRWPQLLFPELKNTRLDPQKTTLLVDAAHALVGRNPARVVLFPVDREGNPITLTSKPRVSSVVSLASITVYRPHGSNGMIFIDALNNEPVRTTLHIQLENFQQEVTVTFAPNCRQAIKECLLRPRWAWWYLQTVVEDKVRLWRNQRS